MQQTEEKLQKNNLTSAVNSPLFFTIAKQTISLKFQRDLTVAILYVGY